MDPVSATASILSLLKATQIVSSWVSHVVHLGEHLRRLHSELKSFEVLVRGLRRAVDGGGLSSEALHRQIVTTIVEAEETVKVLELVLLRAQNGQVWDVSRLRFAMRPSECDTIRLRIQQHTSSLTGIMLVVIHDSSEQRDARLLSALGEKNSSTQPIEGLVSDVRCSKDDDKPIEDNKTADTEDDQHTSPTLADERSGVSSAETGLSVLQKYPSWSVQPGASSGGSDPGTRRASAPAVMNTRPLKISLRRGMFKKLFTMIRSLPPIKFIPENSDAIHIASSGSAADLQALFQSGIASPTDRTADGWTLLMNATYYGKPEVVDLLVKINAALAAREYFGRQAVHFAIIRSFCVGASELDRQRYLRFPNWRDAFEEFEFTSIHAAALVNYPPEDKERPPLATLVEFSDTLNNLPPRPNWQKLKSEYSWRSPLFIRIIDYFRKKECEQRQALGSKFYKVYVDLINECDALQEWTPFHWATYAGRDDSMTTLLQHGANPFVKTPMRRNSLHQAAESMNHAIIKFILDIPSDPILGWFDIDLQDIWGETPLHIAIYRQSPELVRRLLDKGARRDLRSNDGGYVALHYAANLVPGSCQNELVQLLSAGGGPHINTPDQNGCPPLFSLLGNPAAVETLLRACADLGILDQDGSSVIHYACGGNYIESLDMLLSSPSLPQGLPLQPNKAGDIPLAHALNCQSIAAAKKMLERFGPGDLVFKNGRSLVHRAIEVGDGDFLAACFRQPSFRRGVKTKEGWTTKELAARLGRFEGKVRALILQYESYSRGGRDTSEEETRAQARMDYFAIIR